MHPEKLGISACDLESLQQQSQCTQTSSASIDKISKPPSRSSRPPLPRDISKSDKSSITVFEFCQILQDPESPLDVTIIKETVTEETIPHPQNVKDNNSPTSSEETNANRYKYCREVIKPYLKHSTDCTESEEELLKNALDSVSEDFPDYQPCFEVYGTEKDISDKTTGESSRRSSISTVDATTSTTSSKTMDEKVTAPPCPIPVEQCKEPSPPRDCSPPPKIPKKKSAEDNKKCSACPQQPPPIILCDSCPKEPAIGVKCKKPTFYLTERCKDTDSITEIPAEPEDSFVENHKKTISTIKVAMEDFVGKVVKSTKDAVTLITTESAKQIDRVKQMKTESSSTNEPKKCEASKGSETLTSFNFFRKVDSTDSEDKGSGKQELPRIKDVIGVIMTKVDSTLTTLSDTLSVDNIPECLKPSCINDTSSPYDTPAPPKDVANIMPSVMPATAVVPTSNSVFTTIKDKIVSMFREEEPKPTESDSRTSTMTSSSTSSENQKNEDNDDHLIDKVIE